MGDQAASGCKVKKKVARSVVKSGGKTAGSLCVVDMASLDALRHRLRVCPYRYFEDFRKKNVESIVLMLD